MMDFVLVLAATAATGLLAGSSLDQSIKQLPAREKIGVVAYSQYNRASDLRQGILFYGLLGVSAALLNLAAAIAVIIQGVPLFQATPVYLGAAFAVLHSLATTQAAPTLFRQNQVPVDDEPGLVAIFNQFTRWQTIRCVLQMINFGVNLWALVVYARGI